MSSKSYTKDDLKKLMRERIQQSNDKKKIDSPLVCYDEIGNLSCKICNVKIKNETNWSAHLIDQIHKNNLLKFKQNKSLIDTKIKNNLSEKREIEFEQIKPNKIKKQKIIKDENFINLKNETKNLTENIIENNLKNIDEVQIVTEIKQDLPKGFFDNPVDDAKARDEIYQDPLDLEWNKFQKTIEKENDYSENLVETDYTETQIYRNISEIDEQIKYWKKINELEIKKENKKHEIKKNIIEENVESNKIEDNDLELEKELSLFSSWRFKKE